MRMQSQIENIELVEQYFHMFEPELRWLQNESLHVAIAADVNA